LLHFEDFEVFPLLDRNALRQLDDLITKDIPAIMRGSSGVSDAKSMVSSGSTPRRVFKAKSPAMKEESGSRESTSSTPAKAKKEIHRISAASRRGTLLVNTILGLTIVVLAAVGGYVVHWKLWVPPVAESEIFHSNLAPIAGFGEIDREEPQSANRLEL
jgi:hypothetical protein